MSPRTRPRPALRALFLDFDSTISTPTYVKRAGCWAVADNVALFQSMSKAEIVQNAGTWERLLHRLRSGVIGLMAGKARDRAEALAA